MNECTEQHLGMSKVDLYSICKFRADIQVHQCKTRLIIPPLVETKRNKQTLYFQISTKTKQLQSCVATSVLRMRLLHAVAFLNL